MTTSQYFEDSEFEAQLRRLKKSLSVREDQEAAQALGMTKAALSLRKKRGSFPTTKLVELATARPDLGIDVAYVVSGTGAVPGRGQARTDDVLKLLGAVPPGTFENQERLVEIAVRAAAQLRLLRKERADVYEAILNALDMAASETVNTVREVAERMAAADSEKRLRHLRASAKEKIPRAADGVALLEVLEVLSSLDVGMSGRSQAGAGKAAATADMIASLPEGAKVLIVKAAAATSPAKPKAARKRALKANTK